MKIIRLSDGTLIEKAPLCVAALGNFDGVHLGHAKLLQTAADIAAESCGELQSAVWTLSGLPTGPSSVLTDTDEKCLLFREAGISYAFVQNFEDIRDMSPDSFVKKILTGDMNCRIAVCGYNFSFGKNASGGPELLSRLMKENGAAAEVVPPVTVGSFPVSSTEIRRALSDGDTERAELLLGRPYSVRGTVARGRMLGRTLGFPTANVIPDIGRAVPKNGVYLTRCRIVSDTGSSCFGDSFFAVTNVGVRPTVDSGGRLSCESYLLDFSGDIYGKTLETLFYKRLRDEKKFESRDELSAAVHANIEDCRSWASKFSNKTMR